MNETYYLWILIGICAATLSAVLLRTSFSTRSDDWVAGRLRRIERVMAQISGHLMNLGVGRDYGQRNPGSSQEELVYELSLTKARLQALCDHHRTILVWRPSARVSRSGSRGEALGACGYCGLVKPKHEWDALLRQGANLTFLDSNSGVHPYPGREEKIEIRDGGEP